MNFPQRVTLVEVGPRDGLQNESNPIPTDTKIAFINQLSATGLPRIEATAFVSPKWVPQMADHSEVFSRIKKNPHVHYPVLVPNTKGLASALDVGATEVAVFTAASETFSQKNTNASIAETLTRFEPIFQTAKEKSLTVRAYISCIAGCPYEGTIDKTTVAALAKELHAMGADEISLGDTIGVGTPEQIKQVLEAVMAVVPTAQIAVHFHDTYGQALANLYAALQMGIAIIDSSVAGLGGCPYARGASGNVATEDVLYLLQGLGIETGVDLNSVIKAGDYITSALEIPNRSRVANAYLSKQTSED